MRGNAWTPRGFTLVELLVSLGIFSIVSVIMYTTFSTITAATGKVSDTQNLSDKAQRIMSFIEEDLRMVGYIIGPDAQIPYCSNVTTPVLSISPGVPSAEYDRLTFLTSIPISVKETSTCMTHQYDCNPDASSTTVRSDYFLTSRCNADGSSGSTVNVDASASCYDDIVTASGVGSVNNAKAIVTFAALRMTTTQVSGSNPQSYYTVNTLGDTLTFHEALLQTIPDNSTVYGIRRYRFDVDTTSGARTLRRVAYKADSSCSEDPVTLLENSSASGGGIDALKFEFTWLDPIQKNLQTTYTLPPLNTYNFTDLKFITIWAVIRSDKIATGFTDTKTYTMGTTIASSPNLANPSPYVYTPPAGSARNYRRVLVHKTVEVKNLAPIY